MIFLQFHPPCPTCGTPPPPNAIPIDSNIWVLVGLGLILGINFFIEKDYFKEKFSILKDKYFNKKTPTM